MAPLRVGSRGAIVGAGPGGLTAAKHSIQAGFDTTVFEATLGTSGSGPTDVPLMLMPMTPR